MIKVGIIGATGYAGQQLLWILKNHKKVKSLYLSGGSCTLPGVKGLFEAEFPGFEVALPDNPIFFTPYAIAAYDKDKEDKKKK